MKKENNFKRLTTIILTLVAVILIIVGFVGVYLPKYNKIENVVPDFNLGTELNGVLECRFTPDLSEEEKTVFVDKDGNIKGEVVESEDGTLPETSYTIETKNIKANEDKALTKENFEKVKEIFKERLKLAGATEYSIRLDTETGNMVVELSQNDDTELLYTTMLSLNGEFTIEDTQTGVILLDNSHIESAEPYIGQIESGEYVVCLKVNFNEEGAKKLKEISNRYITYVSSTGESTTDTISIKLDGQDLREPMYFSEEHTLTYLNIIMSDALTDQEVINETTESIQTIANIINSGKLPVEYEEETPRLILSSVPEDIIDYVMIGIAILLVVALVVLIVRFKMRGFIAGILNGGFVAFVILALKYLQLVISPSSLIAIFFVIILNLVFLKLYLKNSYLEAMKKYYLMIVPVIVVGFIFTFFVTESVAGIGTVLFWSLLIQIMYNFVFTKLAINDK